ncbi:MAG: Mur ligase family protein [Pirellulaceae bacterium]
MSTSFPDDGSVQPDSDSSVNSGGKFRPSEPKPSGLSLRGLFTEAVFVGAEDIQVTRCKDRASKCQPGDVFIPRHTAAGDEHDRVEEAIRRGAVAVVAERILPVSVPQCLVENTQEAFAQVCQQLAGDPSQRMLTIGIVGAHGKSTTALYVASMLKHLGGAVAYYTSLGASDSTECDRTATRAPGATRLAEWMKRADESGSPAAVIELTPAMLCNRVTSGIEFDLVILTGMRGAQVSGGPSARSLGQLLDQLLNSLKSHGMLLFNADDAQATTWADSCGCPAISYGLDAAEHVRAKRLSRMGAEQQLLITAGNMLMPLTLKTPGDHVARAALAAVATAWMFDFSVPDAIAGTEKLQSIPGRLQRIEQSIETPIYVDDGETPDRVAVAAHALRQHQQGPETIVIDLSCRLDAKWRQRMGEMLDKACTKIVLTGTDLTPPAMQSMAMDVLGGVASPGRAQVIPDREKAIEWAIENTQRGCLLLSGCGVRSWINRDGQSVTDEMLAKAYLADKNSKKPLTFGIFPPSDPNAFFPVDA